MLKVVRDHAQSLANIPDVPPFFAKEPDMRLIIRNWMDLARQQLQKGRFPGTIGTEDGDVLTLLEGQRKVGETQVSPR